MALAESAPGEFAYEAFVSRNFGFVTAAEQERLRAAHVFVCGVGGMGGACLMSLVRAGVGSVTFADFDRFEVSNLNRQLFASLDCVDEDKVVATARQLARINPTLRVRTYGREWTQHLDEILSATSLVINGMDDMRAGIALYRAAAAHGATVIDAYTAPLPSVTVVRPQDPRPEERLGFPSIGREPDTLSDDDCAACLTEEILYVMTHSSSRHHVDLEVAAQMVAGSRKRMSFAPMVITTGNLMCFEAIRAILGRPPGTDFRGYFLNPWTGHTEHPRTWITALPLRLVARRHLRRLIVGAA